MRKMPRLWLNCWTKLPTAPIHATPAISWREAYTPISNASEFRSDYVVGAKAVVM